LELIQRAEAKGISPLELMLEVMHDLWREGDRLAAFACAEKIAPYLHARLAAVEQKVESQVRQTVINGEPMSMEEWLAKYGGKTDPIY
jgi:acyl transferase domain-containing protein